MSSYALTGSYTLTPSGAYPSGDPMILGSLDERMQLANEITSQVALSVDGPVVLPLGALTGANVLVVKAAGGPVTVRLTSSAGITQAIPVDTIFLLHTGSVAITAITVERTPAVLTIVKYTLGQRA